MSMSILNTVFEETAANGNHSSSLARFPTIIAEIEELLERRVLSYFAAENGSDALSMINDEDAYLIENLLSQPSDKKDLVLIIHSNGGLPLSAERIIEVCRNYCTQRDDGSQFYVLVPKRAKSAATIIALGADKIYLRDTSELGPVDPQLNVTDNAGNASFIPAYLQVDALENLFSGSTGLFQRLFEKFTRGSTSLASLPLEIKLKILEQCNYGLYVFGKNELDLSASIIEKIAKQKSLSNSRILQSDFDIFRDPHITKAHGRLITLSDLDTNTLKTEGVVNSARDLFDNTGGYDSFEILIWELYVRKRQLLNDLGNTIVKTIEVVGEDFYMNGNKA